MDQNTVVYAQARLTMVYDQTDATQNKTQEYRVGDTVTLTDNTYDWYSDKDYQNPIDNNSVTMDMNKTIYAKAKTVKLTLVYDQAWHNYGIGSNKDDIKEYAVGAVVDMNDVDGMYSWYEDEDFKNLITAPFTMDADKTIYASGTISGGGDVDPGTGTKIELYYNARGGTIQGETSCTRTFYQATDVNFDDPNYIPTKEGYVFTGWYKEFWLTTKVEGTVTVSENMNVYAGWADAVTLTLVYDIGGGTPDKTIVYAKGTTVDMTEVDATYNWYEDAAFGTQITKPFTMDANKTIYAGQTISGGG
jgi:uncharacterized repeat protein (TIGR02543 family)